MYRVVLIDDENIIVEGLRRVIKWADYGCEVVGTASGAEEGAALIRKLQPHILFTDIRMPGADGLTMLAALRSEFPDMQVTVLTGYQDFSYAQQAMGTTMNTTRTIRRACDGIFAASAMASATR